VFLKNVHIFSNIFGHSKLMKNFWSLFKGMTNFKHTPVKFPTPLYTSCKNWTYCNFWRMKEILKSFNNQTVFHLLHVILHQPPHSHFTLQFPLSLIIYDAKHLAMWKTSWSKRYFHINKVEITRKEILLPPLPALSIGKAIIKIF
jgi:hypothetical protein